MFNFTSLYSGSTGNSFLIQSENTKILVDAGVSTKKIVDALAFSNVDPREIDGIFITHEHIDHVKAIGMISKKFNIPVYASEKTWTKLGSQKEKISMENLNEFQMEKEIILKDMKILPFSTPHDAIDPCGFNIFSGEKKLSIATDLGHITESVFEYLKNSSFALIESNYEVDVLKVSSYPYYLKERIHSDIGHLSNNVAGKIISKLIDSGLNEAMLGHLSKENNFPELAYKTVMEELEKENKKINITVASRTQPSKSFDIK